MSSPLDLNSAESMSNASVSTLRVAEPALTPTLTPTPTASPNAAPGRIADAGRRVLDRLSAEIGRDRVHRYFDRQARVSLSGRTLDVVVASGFVADVVGRRFGDGLRRAAAAELGLEPGPSRTAGEVELRINVDTRAFEPASPEQAAPVREEARVEPRVDARPVEAGRMVARPIARRIETTPRYRFEDLLVGQSNRVAVAAARQLAESAELSAAASGPLFLHGPCGVGKTHLLHAAAHAFRERHPGAVVRVITGEAFTNEFIAAVKAGSLESFRNHVRRVHLLCIDDVHFLSNKEATQRELLHTFDQIGAIGARIMMASDESPREIRKLSQQLVSRFVAGAVVKVDLPEHALRVRIAEQTAVRRGLTLEPAAAELLSTRAAAVGGSVRDLEGLLTQVEAVRLVMPELIPGGRIGAVAVRRALGLQDAGGMGGVGVSGGMPTVRRPIPVPQIAMEVCRSLGVEVGELSAKGRHRTVVLAREITVHLARRLTTSSFPEIARALGRENHSTVLTAHKRLHDAIAAGESPKADLPEDLCGLTLGELCQRIGSRVERSAI